MQPAVITFRPDNLLTVGLLGALAYVAALIVVQLLGRAGLVTLAAPPQPATAAPGAGTVAAA